MNFWEFVPYEYSTTVYDLAEKLMMTSGVYFKQASSRQVFPLSEIAPNMNPASATLLSVDVEGADLEVLKSNDWSRTLPRVVCVEELENPPAEIKSQIRILLESYEYVLIERTLLSSIFVHSSYLRTCNVVIEPYIS